MSTNESDNGVTGTRLPRRFYVRPTLSVARDLLRKTIVYHHPQGVLAADIVETEAYVGEADPACHAAAGRTERNEVMYGLGGFSYIYFIYGMYHCFNVVTEAADFPAAVLVRAVEPVSGQDVMAANSPPGARRFTDGPGKFCRAFGLSRNENGLDLTGRRLYLIDRGAPQPAIETARRIGIRHGRDRLWRFFDANSGCVSRR